MEALIEIILQLFFEIFGEILFTGIAKIIGLFFKKVDTDNLFRKRLKFVSTYVFLGLVITLVATSLIYSTRFLVTISLSYILFQLIVTLLEVVNKDRSGHPLIKFIKVLKKISHYAYPLLLIIFSAIYLENVNALLGIITLSSITLIVWFIIDINRMIRRQRAKHIEFN